MFKNTAAVLYLNNTAVVLYLNSTAVVLYLNSSAAVLYLNNRAATFLDLGQDGGNGEEGAKNEIEADKELVQTTLRLYGWRR